MEYIKLSDTVKIKRVSETEREGVFEIEGLYTGYGLTLRNALRRVLLSSLPGAAITKIKIKGVEHEFSTIPGILEDVIEIILNLKKIRFHFYASEPQILTLKVKKEGKILAESIKTNAQVEIVNPDAHIATITNKNTELDMELTVEKGLGYVSAESRKIEKLPIKTIVIDAIFTPIVKVDFHIENMRVGERTDFNKLKFFIETDGSITPSSVFHKACNILKDHFEKISEIDVKEIEREKVVKIAKKAKSEEKAKK